MSRPSHRFDTLDLFRVVSVWGIVLLHVHIVRLGSSEDAVIRMRDFALPVLIMASFFVMAISFDRRPDRPFGEFFRARVLRILAPSIAWSLIYWSGWWILRPLLSGGDPVLPPVSLALTAYVHLWYLHFIFASAVVLAPVLLAVARGRLPRHPLAIATAGAAVVVMLVVQPWLTALTSDAFLYRPDAIAYAAPDFKTCVSRIAPYLGYAPLGLALALWDRQIGALHAYRWFGATSAAAAMIMLVVHLASPPQPLTRPLFALTVFLAILRPIDSSRLTAVRRLASWTYVIYILHFGFVILAVAALDALGITRTAWSSLLASVVVYAVSLATGVLLRKLPGAGFLLPLVPVAASADARNRVHAEDARALLPHWRPDRSES